MRKILITVLFSLLLSNSNAQGKFIIEGSFNNYEGKVYVVYGAVRDSLYTKNGKFLFSGKVTQPTYSHISIPSKGRLVALNGFWIDKGKTMLELDTVPFKNSRFSGIEVKVKLVQTGDVHRIISNAVAQLNEIKKQNIPEPERNLKLKSVTDSLLKKYPNSIISLYVLVRNLSVYNRDELQNIYRNLPSKMKDIQEALVVKNGHLQTFDIKVGDKLPNFTQSNADGNLISLSDIKAKYVLIDFWASWCVPCRKENPNVVNAYKKYKDKGFDILGVSLDTKKDLWLKAIKDDGLQWRHISDLGGWQNEIAVVFKIKAVPSNFLLNSDGVVVAKNLRGEDLESKLLELFGSGK